MDEQLIALKQFMLTKNETSSATEILSDTADILDEATLEHDRESHTNQREETAPMTSSM